MNYDLKRVPLSAYEHSRAKLRILIERKRNKVMRKVYAPEVIDDALEALAEKWDKEDKHEQRRAYNSDND